VEEHIFGVTRMLLYGNYFIRIRSWLVGYAGLQDQFSQCMSEDTFEGSFPGLIRELLF
jgi:hypothetical protein